jgi:hypothetical protein
VQHCILAPLTPFYFATMAGKDEPQEEIAAVPVGEEIEVAPQQHSKVEMGEYESKQDISHVEQVLSGPDALAKDNMDITRVDKEVQAYAAHSQVVIDDATDKRLKRLIDRRVLMIMIITYFLQALDKGTMSFSAIMGIKEDANLEDGQKVSETCRHSIFSLLGMLTLGLLIVLLVNHVYLHRCSHRRVSHKLDHPKSSNRKVLGHQHLPLGYDSGTSRSLPQLRWVGGCPYAPGYFRGMLSTYFRDPFVDVV